MNAIQSWFIQVTAQPHIHAVLSAIYNFVLPPFMHPRQRGGHAALPYFALHNIERIVQSYLWFLIIGAVVYTVVVRHAGRKQRFQYALLNREPDEKFSLSGIFKYLLPKSMYGHRSVKVDLMYWPISLVLNFFGLLGATVGVGLVQSWLVHHLGHSPLYLPANGLTFAVQLVVVLLAYDFGRFMWHWQGHTFPFFWEFHKGHHSVEVLHPFFIRTHPVDMFIRNAYTGAGGGLIAGTLLYALGINVSVTALTWAASFTAVIDMLQWFEHSHVRISFGRHLNRFFYAPFMHHIHHGAALEHMNKNLGITGGLILWDKLFGTLYWPKPGEKVIWGASLEELGDNNPHRTLWGFLSGPFVGAYQVLRKRNSGAETQPIVATAGTQTTAS